MLFIEKFSTNIENEKINSVGFRSRPVRELNLKRSVVVNWNFELVNFKRRASFDEFASKIHHLMNLETQNFGKKITQLSYENNLI